MLDYIIFVRSAKIGRIHGRLAWPLRKDDRHESKKRKQSVCTPSPLTTHTGRDWPEPIFTTTHTNENTIRETTAVSPGVLVDYFSLNSMIIAAEPRISAHIRA